MSLVILWVRHSPLAPGRVTRDFHLLPRLAREHQVEIVTWEDAETAPRQPWKRLTFRHTEQLGLSTWVIPKLPRPPGWRVWWPSINQPIFGALMRHLQRKLRPDVVVVGPSWTSTGHPPRLNAVRVFDWLDGASWSEPAWRAAELRYLDWANAVIAVSPALARRAEAWPHEVTVIPNGLELDRIEALRGQREAVRRKLGVEGRRVVSLVGLTAADDGYWLGAIRQLVGSRKETSFVAVGGGPLRARLEALARDVGPSVRVEGPVPYERALEWFVASDVTWYPGADTPYFHAAFPLKILEGLGAGAQVVVAPQLQSLAGLSLPSLHFARPTADHLASATYEALEAPPASAETLRAQLRPFSWDALANRVSDFLVRQVGQRGLGAR